LTYINDQRDWTPKNMHHYGQNSELAKCRRVLKEEDNFDRGNYFGIPARISLTPANDNSSKVSSNNELARRWPSDL